MSNEGYFRRKAEQEEKERERRKAADQVPYNPDDMTGKIPLGCTLGGIMFVIGMIYLLYRHFCR